MPLESRIPLSGADEQDMLTRHRHVRLKRPGEAPAAKRRYRRRKRRIDRQELMEESRE